MTATGPATHRERCYRCMRPRGHCVCAGLSSVATRTAVVILQHPQEKRHPFGTARLVGLCLPNARVHTVYGGLRGDLHCPLELPVDTAVLYPHPRAEDLAAVARSGSPPSTLLALDGTWAHAKRLYAENPWLQRLRHVRLHPSEPSRYRIRREPQADYVSTLEAVVAALRLLEPATVGLDALTAAFDRMIDRQVEHLANAERNGRCKRERQRPSRQLPPLLGDPRLVVAYAESSVPGGDKSGPRELVQWAAARVHGDGTFEAVLRPAAAWPTEHHLAHMGLDARALAGGEALAAARERFAGWAGAAPVALWTRSSLDWGRALLAPGTRTCLLKIAYTNLRNHGAGLLEDVVQREGLAPLPTGCRGRAGTRLANVLAVARWLAAVRARALASGGATGGPCS